MRFAVRKDLGGRAAESQALASLADTDVTAPFVVLAGSNGSGKSTLFAALRQATGLVGSGIGRAFKRETMEYPLSHPDDYRWGKDAETGPCEYDFVRHMVSARRNTWSRQEEGYLMPIPGALDPVALGWTGQRVWLHDARGTDNRDNSGRDNMDLRAGRRRQEDLTRSHGEKMAGRLRYAIAWAVGAFDLADVYDRPPAAKPDFRGGTNWSEDQRYAGERNMRDLYRHVSGHDAGTPGRTGERWLLLDEPETGVDPGVLSRLMAVLVSQAAPGKLRVLCATHSPLLLGMTGHPSVQVLDLDGYAARLEQARKMLATPSAIDHAAAAEMALLLEDAMVGINTDVGLQGQGSYTAHGALSLPYASAARAPYGKPSLGKQREPEPVEEEDEDASPGLDAASRRKRGT